MFIAYSLKFNETTIDDISEVEHVCRHKEYTYNTETKNYNTTV